MHTLFNMPVAGAIFDVDGTLLDSMQMWDSLPNLLLKKYGIDGPENLGSILFTMTTQEGSEYLIEHYLPDFTVERIIEEEGLVIKEEYAQHIQAKEGVREMLEMLFKAGIPITIATTSDRAEIESALRRLDMLKFIGHIYTSTETGFSKRTPEMFLLAADFMKAQPSEIFLFEDGLYSVETAKAAGFRTLGLYDKASEKDQEKLKAVADSYAISMKDILAEFK